VGFFRQQDNDFIFLQKGGYMDIYKIAFDENGNFLLPSDAQGYPKVIPFTTNDADFSAWDPEPYRKKIVYENDVDGDRFLDEEDNCACFYNPDQADADDDGWGQACDCDDSDRHVNPGAIEVPDNGLDDDCDGVIDESCGGACQPPCASASAFSQPPARNLLSDVGWYFFPANFLMLWIKRRFSLSR
jgi:hypothetical protein